MKINKPIWLVWNPSGNMPRKVHHTLESAERESERLARTNRGQQFVVLQSISSVQLADLVVTDLRPSEYLEQLPF